MAKHSLTGIIKAIHSIQNQISLDKIRQASRSSQSFQNLHLKTLEHLRHLNRGVEHSLSTRNLTAADLAIRSRRGYQWIKFLSDPQSLLFHLDALQRMVRFLDDGRFGIQSKINIRLFHQGSLYRIQHQGRNLHMVAQESFLTAPNQIVEALVRITLNPSLHSARIALQDYAFSAEYQKHRTTLEYLGVPDGSFAAGEVHHLEDSFQRVNQSYFKGTMEKPNLVWSQRLTHRKFGHYQWDTDTVMVSSTLDDHRIPEMVVDFVIYHELLHKKIGFKQTNQNRIVHSQEFKIAEEQFRQVKEAKQYLNQLSKKKPGPKN